MAARRRLRWLLFGCLALGAALNVGLAIALLGRPDEARYGEAILYDHAARLLRGEALYQPLDQSRFTVAAYTPLYYVLAAGLRAVFGAGFLPGRALSFAAGLVATGLVCVLAWRRTRAAWPTAGAGLLLLALGLVGPQPWFAAYKEDVVGLALELGALVVLDGATNGRKRYVILAAVLAGLAILTKQTLFVPALAGTVWLAATGRWRASALFGGVVLGLVLSVCAWLELTTHAFIANAVLANINPLGWEVLRYNAMVLALFQGVPLLILAIDLPRRLRPRAVVSDLLLGGFVVSLVPLLGLAKEGADYNYWQLSAALGSVLITRALWERSHRLSGTLLNGALALNVLVALTILGRVAVNATAIVRPDAAAEAAFNGVVAEARQAPGQVLADPLDVAVLADRPIVLEPVIYKLLNQVGRWDAAPLVQQVCDGRVSLLVLGYPLEAHPDTQADREWPAPVLAALRQNFVLERAVRASNDARFVYVPREDKTASTCGDGAPQAQLAVPVPMPVPVNGQVQSP